MVQVSLGFNYILPSMSSIFLFFGGGGGEALEECAIVCIWFRMIWILQAPRVAAWSHKVWASCWHVVCWLYFCWVIEWETYLAWKKWGYLCFLKFLVCWWVSWLMSMSLMLCCFWLLRCSWCDLAWKKVVNALNSEFFF